jgi:hypothetical protein
VIIDGESLEIIAVAEEKGSVHDFELFKMSRSRIQPQINSCNDTRYLGIDNLHANNTQPKKKSKLHKLTELEKLKNKIIASARIVIEHVNATLKRFKILANRYRNKQKKHGLRFTLIAELYNVNLRF